VSGAAAYAVFQALALLTAALLKRPSPLPPLQRGAVIAGALFGAGLGAKLPFVLLAEEPFFSLGPWIRDGKTILSGLAGGYLGVELFKHLAGVTLKTGDSFAVPLAAAIAVGRLGCLFNGCCSAPGLYIPLWESAFHGTMAVLLWRLGRAGRFRYQLLKLHLITYAGFRFLVEFARTEPRIAGGLTAYQYGSMALAVLLALHWIADERRKRAEPA
jgi:phosphatidylglycerol:prolipoprotein diacylglycerol transferase